MQAIEDPKFQTLKNKSISPLHLAIALGWEIDVKFIMILFFEHNSMNAWEVN